MAEPPSATVCGPVEEETVKLGGAVADPLNETDCGEPLALSLTVRDAESLPAAVGEKVTEIEQFDPATSVAPQLLLWPKLLALVPVIAMPVMESVAPPEFESVTVCTALEVPAAVVKLSGPAGLNVAAGTGFETVSVTAGEVLARLLASPL